MAEVYRADDLRIGQPVALKFLPTALERDEDRLERLYSEVRTARQVSHANVCRIYDVGETEGQPYISMEYIDGEDLSSLLRRIGRMPEERAIEMARQLCAGLAAAHAQGILHRDLKPANVMIDGRGRVHITDFGLAALTDDIAETDVRAGTPAYMAPEQLAGQEVTLRSDIYALGLVLYELFTGKPAYDAASQAELMRMHQTGAPTSPSSFVSALDPAVERVILLCLEADPMRRPASALEVAAALPGGDPLAAALAAGETPSPRMVADAGAVGSLSPLAGLSCVLGTLLGILALVHFLGHASFWRRIDLPKSPDVLAQGAQDLIAQMGYLDPPVHSVRGFDYDQEFIEHVRRVDAAPGRWDGTGSIRPAPLGFWYRQSPRFLVPVNSVGWVTFHDPPARISGSIDVRLDPQGRLLSLLVVPPEVDPRQTGGDEPDWEPLFRSAGLSLGEFEPTEPTWNPLINCGVNRSWRGAYPDQPDVPITVQACSYAGRPAWFEVQPPWRTPSRLEQATRTTATSVAIITAMVVVILVLGAGVLLARRNVLLGRVDRTGAFRIALFIFAAYVLFFLLRLDHVASLAEIGLLGNTLMQALFNAALGWLIYIALEPYVRKLWPDVLIAWSRLITGRFKDPLVGRDLLLGALAGIWSLVWQVSIPAINRPLGLPGITPLAVPLEPLFGTRQSVGWFFANLPGLLLISLSTLLLMLLLRIIVRRQWLTFLLTVLLLSLLYTAGQAGTMSAYTGSRLLLFTVLLLLAAPPILLFVYFMMRFGIFATVVLFAFSNIPAAFPLTFDLSAWYAGSTVMIVMVLTALLLYGFWISRAGSSLLPGKILP